MVTLWLPYGYLMVRVLPGYSNSSCFKRHSCIVRVLFMIESINIGGKDIILLPDRLWYRPYLHGG